jgi:hypothetical protein
MPPLVKTSSRHIHPEKPITYSSSQFGVVVVFICVEEAATAR